MSFLMQRMLNKNVGYNAPPYIPPQHYMPQPIQHVELSDPIPLKTQLEAKKKYKIGDTKPDIIENIIEFKPPVATVRKAIQEYINMTERDRDF